MISLFYFLANISLPVLQLYFCIYLGSVSVWNNNNELMSGSIINSFRMLYRSNTPFLSLRCFAGEGHGELQWRTKNVSSLSETLSDKAVPGLSVVGTGQDLTLNYADIDTNDTGYYVCYSRMSGESFEVFTTLGELLNMA